MELGTLVKNKNTGTIGVVVDDPFNCCSEKEVPVVYEGVTFSSGTFPKDLEILGQENAQADLEKCGAGQEENCCIFLVIGETGPECQRFGSLRTSLIFKKGMVSKREPSQLFPSCQLN